MPELIISVVRGNKFRISAQDSVIGANSPELRDKILTQIPKGPRKTKAVDLAALSC